MSDLAAAPTSIAAGQLVIEQLVLALEKAASVDEIKDVRDRAMAIQLYTRKKQGGLDAAKAAGRVVTHATLKLAKLYSQEKSAQSSNLKKGRLVEPQDGSSPGKKAIAEAAGMDPGNLARMKPLVDLSPEDLEAAKVAIEQRGDVVTPNALLREVVGEPDPGARPDAKRVVVVINGRRLSTPQVAALLGAVAEKAEHSGDAVLAELTRMLQGRKRSSS